MADIQDGTTLGRLCIMQFNYTVWGSNSLDCALLPGCYLWADGAAYCLEGQSVLANSRWGRRYTPHSQGFNHLILSRLTLLTTTPPSPSPHNTHPSQPTSPQPHNTHPSQPPPAPWGADGAGGNGYCCHEPSKTSPGIHIGPVEKRRY